MKFNFIGYKGDLYGSVFNRLPNLQNSLIVLENTQNIDACERAHFHAYGLSSNEIITKEELKRRVFLKDRPFLDGISRLVAFFKSLKPEHKKRFGINNLFDCIDFGKRFFRLYEELIEERKIKEYSLYKWQKEVFNHLEDIKESYRNYIVSRDLEDRIFIYNPSTVSKSDLNYDKIIVINTLYLSRLERALFNTLDGVELYLQIDERDYDKSSCAIKDVPIPQIDNLRVVESEDSFAQALNLAKEIKDVDDISICNLDRRNRVTEYFIDTPINGSVYFHKSGIYCFLDTLLEIVEGIEIVNDEIAVKVGLLMNKQNNRYFANYYKLTGHDKGELDFRMKSGYKYLTQSSFGASHLFNDLSIIFKLSSVEEFINFFDSKTFLIKGEEYKDIEEIFYSTLAELKSIKSNILDSDWSEIFSSNKLLFANLLRLLLVMLKNRKITIQNATLSSDVNEFIEHKKLILLNTNSYLQSAVNNPFFLTEGQRDRLGLKSNNQLKLEERYKIIRAMHNSEFVSIYYILSDEPVSIVEEIRRYNKVVVDQGIRGSNYLNYCRGVFPSRGEGNFSVDSEDAMPFSFDEVRKESEFTLGFYDYYDIVKCQYRYYLKDIAKIGIKTQKIKYRVEPNLLGNIIHSILNIIAERKDGDIKSGDYTLKKREVVDLVEGFIKEERLKIPPQYTKYYDKILFPFIVKGVLSFYKALKNRVKGSVNQIYVEGPKKLFLGEHEGIAYGIKGKADLRIETSNQNIIIDYKTGYCDPKQLDFYHILYYDNESNVYRWFYKFFDEIIKEETKSTIFLDGIKSDIERLINTDYYYRTKNRSICRFCDYVEICKIRGI